MVNIFLQLFVYAANTDTMSIFVNGPEHLIHVVSKFLNLQYISDVNIIEWFRGIPWHVPKYFLGTYFH